MSRTTLEPQRKVWDDRKVCRCSVPRRPTHPGRSETRLSSSSPARVLEDTFVNFLEDIARRGDTERSYKLPIRLIKYAALRCNRLLSKGDCVEFRNVAGSPSEILSAIVITRMFVFTVDRHSIMDASATQTFSVPITFHLDQPPPANWTDRPSDTSRSDAIIISWCRSCSSAAASWMDRERHRSASCR